ncbi:hypothetical protein V500_08366 [Pseudogymnoascus sp. VKM F-4518 (FW-2643)]|nr:hypothetical protein V500_08366 [Pseudogymnoascus sp. VKM F-4518 (FW-2643)]
MSSLTPPSQPSLPWRIGSSVTIGAVGAFCRTFLYGFNDSQVVGLDRFLKVLEERRDVGARTRGLLTVSNHVSVMDDPLMWGFLPYNILFNPSLQRWSLGSYDICFKNKALSTFFSLGQTLPTHRTAHSEFGGLFQPTITQAIRLLSAQPFLTPEQALGSPQPSPSASPKSPDVVDPFSSNSLVYPITYSTNGTDVFPAPSAYDSRKHSWVHIFPEGRIHQHPALAMRYFKWGVSRMILESEPLPDIIPIFIDGTQHVMHESRTFPRFIPRTGKKIKVVFGDSVDGEKVFGDLRRRWRALVEMQREALKNKGQDTTMEMGVLTEGLKYNAEAVALRLEATQRMRNEVVKLRNSLGYDEEDPKNGLVETWIEEGRSGAREGHMKDDSWTKDT